MATINGTIGNDNLNPNNPNPDLQTTAGDDVVFGLAGNDSLDGGGGVNELRGGEGSDTYIYDDDGVDNIVESPGEGTDTVVSSVDFSLADTSVISGEVENLTLDGAAITGIGNGLNNTIIGNDLDNNLQGNGGDDNLQGGLGRDTLDGGAGNNTLSGGADDDTYITDGNDTINESAGDGEDTVLSSANYTLANNLENLTLTGTAINGTGNSGANTIIGNDLANTLDGGGGIDQLTGGDGNDTYVVNSISDNITETAGAGIDTVKSSSDFILDANVENLILTGTAAIDGTGNDGVNIITGNSAANTLDGQGGADDLTGGEGNDTYVVDNAGDSITENGVGDIDTVESSSNYTLGTNLENLTLTGTATEGTGNGLDNRITGNNAANTLDGGAGDDILVGDAGDDTYIADSTNDNVIETADEGRDTVLSSATFTLDANVENLTLTGTSAINGTGNILANTIIGNGNDNVLNGGGGNDDLSGGAGDDVLDGDAGTDALSGGVGNDTYIIDGTLDTVTEVVNAGTDTVESSITYTLDSNVENLTLTGTSAIDGTGNGEDNKIIGNSAANTLRGLGGIDTLIGGLGNDTYYVDDTPDVITEGAGGGIDNVFSSVNYTLGATSNLENLTLLEGEPAALNGTGNNFNNTIVGNNLNNILNGLGGNDVLNANGGDDLLDGGTGTDKMDGGLGNDTYIVDTVTDTTIESTGNSGGGGIDSVKSSISYTLSANVDNLELTGTNAINGTGNTLANNIKGNSAANTLDGKDGADILTGFAGNDTYIVDDSRDQTLETVNAGTDTVKSSVGWELGNNLENLTLTGTLNINGFGNAGNNTINGNSGHNVLDGRAGSDKMQGGAGDDSYYVDRTTDQTIEAANAGNDSVVSSINWTLATNVEVLVLNSSADINGTGNELDNTIVDGSIGSNNILKGGGGNDAIFGAGGNDTLIGQAGVDQLHGQAGADKFVFNSTSEGIDTIVGFEVSVVGETIQVSKAGFGGGLTLGTLAASQFVIGSAAADSSDRFIYNSSTGALSFDANGNGAGGQVQFATLSTGLNMTNNDISVIA